MTRALADDERVNGAVHHSRQRQVPEVHLAVPSARSRRRREPSHKRRVRPSPRAAPQPVPKPSGHASPGPRASAPPPVRSLPVLTRLPDSRISQRLLLGKHRDLRHRWFANGVVHVYGIHVRMVRDARTEVGLEL